jgi:hypothetical protein
MNKVRHAFAAIPRALLSAGVCRGFRSGARASLGEESFRHFCHLIKVSASENRCWPLPSHEPKPPKSNFSFWKISTLTVSFRACDAKPNTETVWLETWDVPLSERLETSGLRLDSLDSF